MAERTPHPHANAISPCQRTPFTCEQVADHCVLCCTVCLADNAIIAAAELTHDPHVIEQAIRETNRPPVDLAAARSKRDSERRTREATIKADGNQWTVEDMMKDSLAMLASGERKIVKGVFVYLYEIPPSTPNGESRWKVGFGQAGMSRAEEAGFLALALDEALRDWRD